MRTVDDRIEYGATWIRGGRWSLESRDATWGGKEYFARTELRTGEQYAPLSDAPEAYREFAKLRRDLWAASETETLVEPFVEPFVQEWWDQLRPFVVEYGAPLQDSMDDFKLADAFNEAGLMAVAIRCRAYIDNYPQGPGYENSLRRCFRSLVENRTGLRSHSPTGYEGYPRAHRDMAQVADFDTSAGLLKAARAWLQDTINFSPNALSGIRTMQVYDPDRGWQPRYTFTSLATAMWLQMHQSMMAKELMRDCKGCPKEFTATRTNKVYCDEYCRASAESRRRYWGGEDRGRPRGRKRDSG